MFFRKILTPEQCQGTEEEAKSLRKPQQVGRGSELWMKQLGGSSHLGPDGRTSHSQPICEPVLLPSGQHIPGGQPLRAGPCRATVQPGAVSHLQDQQSREASATCHCFSANALLAWPHLGLFLQLEGLALRGSNGNFSELAFTVQSL